MRPIHRILVGTDFSPAAQLAVAQAMHLARHLDAELTLVHAYPFTSAQISLAQTTAYGSVRQALREALVRAHDDLETAYEAVARQGVAVSTLLVDAPAHAGIATAARDLDADLVIVGSLGRTGLSRFLLGSVAERTVRTCPCSVFVARSEIGPAGFRRIVVPTDFSPLSEAGATAALSIAEKGAAIQLVHCWQMPPMLDDFLASLAPLAREIQDDADSRGRDLASRYRTPEVDTGFVAVQGPPNHAICQYLEATNADLAVVGSHGRRGMSRLILGSVAESTARHATCSVLVVRQPASKE